MPDPISELKGAIQKTIDRLIDAYDSAAIPDTLPSILNALNPDAGTDSPGTANVFATGYDGTNTTMAFVFDVSEFDGPDILL